MSGLQSLCPMWLLWASLCTAAWKGNSTLHWSPRYREHFWHLYMFLVTILILIVLLHLDVYFNSNLTHLIEMIKTCKKHTEICCITGTLHLFPLNRLGWRKGRVFLFTRLQTFLTFNHINNKKNPKRVIYVAQPILWKSYFCCKKKLLMLHSLGFLLSFLNLLIQWGFLHLTTNLKKILNILILTQGNGISKHHIFTYVVMHTHLYTVSPSIIAHI